MSDYREFLARKSQLGGQAGFEPTWMPSFLKPFQHHLDLWAVRRGRAAILADCGLGKTPMLLVFAQNVVEHTNKPVLIATPLAVAKQTVREGIKFGVEVHRSMDGSVPGKIVVTNYERLNHFNPADFCCLITDEASCIKAMDGARRDEVTEFQRTLPYRLACTATAAPNDYVELGTLSEALGEMGQQDMITKFFKQETKKDYLGWGRTKYRMRGHAETHFWRWVCSWARACRKPSDLGFDDAEFVLPPCTETEHVVQSRTLPPGFLFSVPASDMREELAERRRTIPERCEKAAELVANTGKPAAVWCHLNGEGDLLTRLIKDGRQVKGSDSVEAKEEAYEAFASGQLRVIILKPKTGAWGLNWQHCAHVVTFASHSYEQYYQLKRRCWRFGQTEPVQVDRIVTEGEQRVAENLDRKEKAADRMFAMLVEYMNDALRIERTNEYLKRMEVPAWL